jgi:hypothetical protein
MRTRRDRISTGTWGRTRRGTESRQDHWARWNRSIRFYGLVLLVGTKLTDVVTTAIGVRYVPSIVEANPVANGAFADLGLLTGLTVFGAASVLLATGAAELLGLEIRRRLGLETTALCAQASIYLALVVLFGLVSLHNAALIAGQFGHLLGEALGAPTMFAT